MRTVELTDEAYTVLCGLVQDDDTINADGIFASAECWQELRETFPVSDFPQDDPNIYDADFGY